MHVAFEGPDGCGKSTLIASLAKHYGCLSYRQPGATEVGRKIRYLIKNDMSVCMSKNTEQALMFADYCQYVDEVLVPNAGRLVLSDRCSVVSGIVYGLAGGCDVGFLRSLFVNISKLSFPKLHLFVLRPRCFESLCDRQHDDVVDGAVVKCKFQMRGSDFHKRVFDIYMNVDRVLVDVYGCDFDKLFECIRFIDAGGDVGSVFGLAVRCLEEVRND